MKLLRIGIVTLSLAAVGLTYWLLVPTTRLEKAYHICGSCGMSETDVDELIELFTRAPESREVLMGLYRGTFDDLGKLDCEDCGEAILEAAGIP